MFLHATRHSGRARLLHTPTPLLPDVRRILVQNLGTHPRKTQGCEQKRWRGAKFTLEAGFHSSIEDRWLRQKTTEARLALGENVQMTVRFNALRVLVAGFQPVVALWQYSQLGLQP